MALTSFAFIACFIVSLAIYYLIPKRLQWYFLLLCSAGFFLVSCKPFTIIYLVISIISTKIICGILSERKSKALLICGIVINLGILCTLKYTNFFLDNLNQMLIRITGDTTIHEVDWAAPLGISFYTMQVLAYIIDVYWGETKPQTSFLRTALFIGYWPQLKSGPIARHNEMKDQLYKEHDLSWKNVTFGLQRMMWGIFKSLVISNRLGIMVDTIYGDTIKYNGFYIWFAASAFMLQLYTDFSGCMDIVLGASECYGIVLPENFRTPFFSRSVQEYWQRWHITLGGFMRDYVMNTILRSKAWRKLNKSVKVHMGKRAAMQIPSYLDMLIVWLLMGIWHGGSWKYGLGMGLWFFLCIALGRTLDPVFKKTTRALRVNTEAFSWHLFQSVRVFVLVAIGNMFFRLDSLADTFSVMRRGFSRWNPWIFFDGSLYELGISDKDFRLVITGLLVLFLVSALQVTKGSVRELIAKQNYVFRWIVYLLLISAIIIFGTYGPGFDAQTFIYEGF